MGCVMHVESLSIRYMNLGNLHRSGAILENFAFFGRIVQACAISSLAS